MVGVVGKSKACHDCRRRRVKCDLRQPKCRKCEKANIACQGYERAAIFVNRTLAAPSTNAQTAISESQNTSIAISSTSIHLQILQQLMKMEFNPSEPTEFRALAWTLLKDLYLPKCQSESKIDSGDTIVYSWLPTTCRLKGRSDALDHSIIAFAAIQVHCTGLRCSFPDAGLQLYTQALQELVKELGQNHEKISEETMAAIVVLSTCELFVLPNEQGWSAHAQGISEILKQRSSSEFLSPTWQSLFARSRIVCVILGLAKRQALVLGADRWKQLISQKRTPTSFETLMDIISEVPQLMEEAESLLTCEDDVFTPRASSLLQSLLNSVQKLYAWRKTITTSLGKPRYWAVPTKLHNPSDDRYSNKLFPFALEFESLHITMPLLLSSGVMVQILSTMLQIYSKPGFNENTMNSSLFNGDIRSYLNADDNFNLLLDTHGPKYAAMFEIRAMGDKLARFCCQSIEYCHRNDLGTLGPQSTCHTQWALRRYFRQVGLDRELDWCKNIRNMTGPNSRCDINLRMLTDD